MKRKPDCTTIRVRDRSLAFGIERRLKSWALSNGVQGKIASIVGRDWFVSQAVPYAAINHAVQGYRPNQLSVDYRG